MMEKRKKIKRCTSDRVLTTVFYAVAGVFAIACLYPLLLAIGTSFTDEASITVNGYNVIPREFSLEAYQMIFGSLGKNLFNAYCVTIGVTVCGTILSILVSSSFAYVLTVREFKPRGALNMFLYIPMIFSAGLLPWYIMCTKYYHLTNNFLALVLPCCINAFNVFLLRNFFKSIPEELAEAAKIDGANYLRIFSVIYFPLAKVGLVTVGLFYALSYWNDYYLSLMFISRQNMYPLQYYLYNMLSNVQFMANQANASLGYNINIPLETTKMATICVTIGPIILLYPFAQKYITKGVIVGAVKG
ncbi:carbohydrate ABC transporter permease [Candidatus Acetatifactor stercoripullorum]|uniref:carbohydrate ABC transporter permease n=1 Tax=Candidatus Acetatifactor stercoripullorum TaxID=2838414 RepID=UPI00298DEADB|nr:carbohydrate ABC transporter permease [Candidatus Acetatifactor stercoripullorum]